MKYSVRIGDQESEVEAGSIGEDGVCTITTESDRRDTTIQSVAPHQVRVTPCPAAAAGEELLSDRAPQQSRSLFLARAAEGVWVWSAGRARLVRPAEERRVVGRGAGDATAGPVTPPMPAVVTELRVEVGQTVEEGQALVVVSAMKMEMTLAAPHAGTVTAIHTEPGAKVNPGDILVDVAPLAEESQPSSESHS